MINIIIAVGGCGYVYVSWFVFHNVPDDAMCGIGHVNVTLSSVDVSRTVMPVTITHNFTGLPGDTQYTVTVTGASINERNIIDVIHTYVKTMIIEGSYMHMCACKVYLMQKHLQRKKGCGQVK